MRALSPVRAGVGVVQLFWPNLLFRPLIVGGDLNSRERNVVRVLGARQLIQALISGPTPTGAVLGLGAEVDVAHAASMIALALHDRRYRRAALADAFIAGSFAVAGARDARTAAPRAVAASRLGRLRNQWADRLARSVVPGYLPLAPVPATKPSPQLAHRIRRGGILFSRNPRRWVDR